MNELPKEAIEFLIQTRKANLDIAKTPAAKSRVDNEIKDLKDQLSDAEKEGRSIFFE